MLVRSFARIHETNLKKQGLLPLTFADPADYEKVREGDRASILGLADLAPGKPVKVVFHHADGTNDEVQARHTLNAEQIRWFRAGSALNLLRAQRNLAANLYMAVESKLADAQVIDVKKITPTGKVTDSGIVA